MRVVRYGQPPASPTVSPAPDQFWRMVVFSVTVSVASNLILRYLFSNERR